MIEITINKKIRKEMNAKVINNAVVSVKHVFPEEPFIAMRSYGRMYVRLLSKQASQPQLRHCNKCIPQ